MIVVAIRLTVLAALSVATTGCVSLGNAIQSDYRYLIDDQLLTKKADADRKPGERPSGVNAYLWRASMDTIGFLPLETADPQYGRIVTKWYSQPSEPAERSRVIVEILDPDLRRDTVRVTVARQIKGADGDWSEAPAPSGTAQSLEDSIYTKALDISPY